MSANPYDLMKTRLYVNSDVTDALTFELWFC